MPASIVLPRERSCWYCQYPSVAAAVVSCAPPRISSASFVSRWFASDQTSFDAEPSGPGTPVFVSAVSDAVVRVLERLQLDPLARDPVEQHRVGDVPLLRERDQLAHGDVERRGEREPERAALVEQRRHRDLPAVADLAEQVLLRHLDVGEEDLVELGVAGDLHERPHLDAGRVHVDDHVRQVLVARRVGTARGRRGCRSRRCARTTTRPSGR